MAGDVIPLNRGDLRKAFSLSAVLYALDPELGVADGKTIAEAADLKVFLTGLTEERGIPELDRGIQMGMSAHIRNQVPELGAQLMAIKGDADNDIPTLRPNRKTVPTAARTVFLADVAQHIADAFFVTAEAVNPGTNRHPNPNIVLDANNRTAALLLKPLG